MLGRYRWLFVFCAALATGGAGLYVGKMKEKNFLGPMYERKNFTLLDSDGNLFELRKFPDNKLLLLIFTPDGIPPRLVKPFAEFSRRIGELKKLDVETRMITRMNREIVRNFKEATRFPGALLVDAGGVVGKLLGVWPNTSPVDYWSYALVDNKMQLYWAVAEKMPLTYEDLLSRLKKLSASMKTSSESP